MFPVCSLFFWSEILRARVVISTSCRRSMDVDEEPTTPPHRVPTAGSASRKRLRQKTTPPKASDASQAPRCGSTVPQTQEDLLVGSQKRKEIQNWYAYWWRRATQYHQKTTAQRAILCSRYNLKCMSIERREQCLREFQQCFPQRHDEIEAYIRRVCVRSGGPGERAGKRDSVFLTWQGEWGDIDREQLDVQLCVQAALLLPDSAAKDEFLAFCLSQAPGDISGAVSAWQQGDPEVRMKSANLVAAAMKHHPKVLEMADELRSLLNRKRQERGVLHSAWSLELCTRTWLEECRVKVHAHMSLGFGTKNAVVLDDTWTFLGSAPFDSRPNGGGSFSRIRNHSSGCFYLQAAKVGKICSEGSHQPYSDYPVNPLWIFSLLQSGKMLYASARADMCRLPQGIVRNLESLERWHRERQTATITAVGTMCEKASSRDMRPWKVYPMVTMWQSQYACARPRYGFLVLDGPSRMGKTQFARCLSQAPGGVLELNMAGSAKVDLRLYDPLVHDVLLFDECDPVAVLENKKLFQAGGARISMQTSATNIMAFTVCVAEKKFVVCSNLWGASLSKLPWVDVEWLRSNSYYVHVTEPMWQEAAMENLPVGEVFDGLQRGGA